MCQRNHEKYWDIICVSKSVRYKKLNLFLNTVRKIYDTGNKYRILLIVASNKNENTERFYTNIHDDYQKMFNNDEREYFSIIRTHPETGFQGFSYELISHFYNQSKVFTLFSAKEGQSKAIKEAQLCGLPVVVYKDLVGGGRAYLTDNVNALFFDAYESAHTTLIEAVENCHNFKINYDQIHQEIGEEPSLGKLKDRLVTLYAQNNQKFDGELINTDCLNRRLPAHYFDASVTWASTPEYRFKTTDIVDFGMLENFRKCLKL
ncbi:MAG: glycosyltransferase [Stappiaceae bacterium]